MLLFRCPNFFNIIFSVQVLSADKKLEFRFTRQSIYNLADGASMKFNVINTRTNGCHKVRVQAGSSSDGYAMGEIIDDSGGDFQEGDKLKIVNEECNTAGELNKLSCHQIFVLLFF